MLWADTDVGTVVLTILSYLGTALAGAATLAMAILPILQKYRAGEAATNVTNLEKAGIAYEATFRRMEDAVLQVRKENTDKQLAIDRLHQLNSEYRDELQRLFGTARLILEIATREISNPNVTFPELPEISHPRSIYESEYLQRTQKEVTILAKSISDSVRIGEQ